eukprot:XP_017170426.1 PREDICTED: phosphatidylinositol N-acetylglucosaminyltransferase subunit H isoform X2 [Mus musculus]
MVGSQRDFEPPGGLERRDIQVCAAMEDEKSFSDICGGRLALRCRYYSPYCREFGLSSARLSLCSLTAVTCAVWLAAYGLFTLCEHGPLCHHLHHHLRPAWLPPFCED